MHSRSIRMNQPIFKGSYKSPSSFHSKKQLRSAIGSKRVYATASFDEMDKQVPIDEALKRSETSSKKSTDSFKDTMGFAGWAPEVINCRAGMIAFVSALGAEVNAYNHPSFASQAHDHVFSVVFASVLITAATFMPAMQNEKNYTSKPSSKPYGIFTPEAELTNGRLAIVGFFAAMVAEKFLGHAFFA